jgi:SH3-like domain-containing protein
MTAMRYDPARPVDAEEWSQLDEGDQIELVVEHHRRARIRLPNLRLHAGLHVTVENQVLLGEETPVAAALQRLMGEGLDRHDAIHAIASVLSGVMYDAVTRKEACDLKADYYSEVSRLTAEGWRSQAGRT